MRTHACISTDLRVRKQVFLQNITEVFGSDLAIPGSLDSPDWANVSLATSECSILLLFVSHLQCPAMLCS